MEIIEKISIQLYFLIPPLIIILGIYLLTKYIKKEKKSHTWRKKSAKKFLETIKNIEHTGQLITYLRKIDAFVLEEMVLSILESREDINIERNSRYTGDGGIDGKFVLLTNNTNKKGYIQVKRYSSYINNKDVEKFLIQIENNNIDVGLFIHTGKSGKKTYQYLGNKVKLISGDKLMIFFKKGIF